MLERLNNEWLLLKMLELLIPLIPETDHADKLPIIGSEVTLVFLKILKY
jgi:hypothetical protein